KVVGEVASIDASSFARRGARRQRAAGGCIRGRSAGAAGRGTDAPGTRGRHGRLAREPRDDRFPVRLHVGCLDLRLPDRGGARRRRQGRVDLGPLRAPARQRRGRQHRRRGHRPLPPLPRGRGAAGRARGAGVPLPGRVAAKGLEFYDRLLDLLVANGVRPWLCLYHWDLPQALQDRGGWTARDTAYYFADYAELVAERLGDRVDTFLMLNEPNVHALLGHLAGQHAPGLSGLSDYLAAVHHQNLAVAAGVERL